MGSQSVIDWRKSAESHDPLLRSMRETNFNLRTNDSVQTCFLLAVCPLRADKNLSALQREGHSRGAIWTGHGVHVHSWWQSLWQHWMPSHVSVATRFTSAHQSSARHTPRIGHRK